MVNTLPSSADHFKGCCLEMLTFLAVIYFLKSVLNFDVFYGPVQLKKLNKKQTDISEKETNDKSEHEDTSREFSDNVNSTINHLKRVSDDELSVDDVNEDDVNEVDNDLTCDKGSLI